VSRETELSALIGQFKHWEAWVGVSGRLYARRPRSSPAIVVSANDTETLAAEIERAIKEHKL
jgi:hypothetical protein